jgi:hypothetical protein
MPMVRQTAMWVVLGVALVGVGCSSGSGSSSDNGGGISPELTKLVAESKDAAMAEVQKHWAKSADGWTTARTLGSGYAPEHLLRQGHELTITSASAVPLTDGDKLNGFEYAGIVEFKKAPFREAGDPGIAFDGTEGANINRVKGKWTQWIDIKPEDIQVQKVRGQWQVHQDTWLLRGTLPTQADWTNAGVK